MFDHGQYLTPRTFCREFELWTPEELAAALEVTPATLRIWRDRGRGPSFVKAGRKVFYRIEDVGAWLKANTYAKEELVQDPSTPDSSSEPDSTPTQISPTPLPPLPAMQEQNFPEPTGVLQ